MRAKEAFVEGCFIFIERFQSVGVVLALLFVYPPGQFAVI